MPAGPMSLTFQSEAGLPRQAPIRRTPRIDQPDILPYTACLGQLRGPLPISVGGIDIHRSTVLERLHSQYGNRSCETHALTSSRHAPQSPGRPIAQRGHAIWRSACGHASELYGDTLRASAFFWSSDQKRRPGLPPSRAGALIGWRRSSSPIESACRTA